MSRFWTIEFSVDFRQAGLIDSLWGDCSTWCDSRDRIYPRRISPIIYENIQFHNRSNRRFRFNLMRYLRKNHRFFKEKRNSNSRIAIIFQDASIKQSSRFEIEDRFESINKPGRIDRGAFVAARECFSCSPFCAGSPGARFSFRPTVINAPLGQSTVKKRAKEEREREGPGLMCLNEPLILERRVH